MDDTKSHYRNLLRYNLEKLGIHPDDLHEFGIDTLREKGYIDSKEFEMYIKLRETYYKTEGDIENNSNAIMLIELIHAKINNNQNNN
jgi:hypothetical protein